MLEIVGVQGTVVHHGVGHHIVVVNLDVQGDALGGQDLLGDLQDLGVRRGGGGHGDGLALQGVVIHGIVIAIAGVGDGADHGAVILALDEAGHLPALQSGLQGQDLGGILVALLHGQDVGIGGGGALDGQGVLHGVQPGVDGVVGVDNGVVGVLQHIGQTGGLGLYDLHVIGVLHNVVLGGGNACAVPQLDDAVLLQQQQGPGLVGGVVGNGDLQGGALGAAARQGQGQGQDQRQNQRRQLHGSLFHDVLSPCYH